MARGDIVTKAMLSDFVQLYKSHNSNIEAVKENTNMSFELIAALFGAYNRATRQMELVEAFRADMRAIRAN